MQDMEQIYEQYFETVYKYLFCLTRNSDIAEELTQETFYRAVKKINTFKEDCKISVWLCQIAIKTVKEYLGKNENWFEKVVFNVFTEEDDNIYQQNIFSIG